MAKKKQDEGGALAQFGQFEQNPMMLEEAKELRYLPGLKINTGMSKAFKSGAIPRINVYVLDGKKDLGNELRAVVGPARPRATVFDIDKNEVTEETFDIESDAYARIKAGGKRWEKGYSYGPEFLFWLPDFETFALFHCARSQFDAAQPLLERQGKAVILKVRLKGKKDTAVCDPHPLDGVDMPPAPQQKFEEAFRLFESYKHEKKAESKGKAR